MTDVDAPSPTSGPYRPQDDLFAFVNADWLAAEEIPPDLSTVGSFIILHLDAERQVAEILREAEAEAEARSGTAQPGTVIQQVGELFASFVDEETVEGLGVTPVSSDLAAIDDIATLTELVTAMGRLTREGALDGAIQPYVDTDARRSDRYVVYLTQGGLGLPDESYYREENFADTRAAYLAHIATMLELAGQSAQQAAADSERIMALETRLAAGHWDRVARRDVVKSYNLRTRAELEDAAHGLDWSAWADGLQAPPDALAEVVVKQPSYLTTLSEALQEVPLENWKAWLRFHLLSGVAPYLSTPLVEANFDFYSRTLTGAQELRERWKRGVALVNGLLGEAVGQQYVERHFPPESKAAIDDLVANLVRAYRQDIEKLDWMGPDTRSRALEKLETFRPKVGYPEKWRDYSSIRIERDDLVGNVRRASAFESDRQLAKIGQPVDRDEWFMTPQTVNAYYNPGTNEICFPAAILQEPFFTADADPARNYGGIGAVIGHEIGHGFDDQGSQYDGEGNLIDWWTSDDRARFQQRADLLIAQYDQFEPRALPGHHVNGALTVGENIGDLGGLTVALQAYELSLDGEPAPVIDGLTGVQRLMVNWARCWRVKRREAMEIQLLSVDPHAPPEFRANIVRNLDEFHEAFETSPGDGLWLDPAERVRIW